MYCGSRLWGPGAPPGSLRVAGGRGGARAGEGFVRTIAGGRKSLRQREMSLLDQDLLWWATCQRRRGWRGGSSSGWIQILPQGVGWAWRPPMGVGLERWRFDLAERRPWVGIAARAPAQQVRPRAASDGSRSGWSPAADQGAWGAGVVAGRDAVRAERQAGGRAGRSQAAR